MKIEDIIQYLKDNKIKLKQLSLFCKVLGLLYCKKDKCVNCRMREALK
jgi:hypothetical protein